MAFVPVPNTALVEIRMTQDVQEVENTLYFEFDAPPDSTVLGALGEAILNWWTTNLAALLWSGLNVREIVCTDLTTATGPQVATVPETATHGTGGGQGLPNNASLSISFRTGFRGRSFRGRNYIIGLLESQTNSPNEVEQATVDAFVAAYTALLPVAEALSATWVVASRFSGVDGDHKPIPRTTGLTTPILSVVAADNIIDSQRRRLPGRGK